MARLGLEEKAQQLAVSSKYKSEFLANMSHELRTPLNSLLILAKLLGDNEQGNLDEQQVEFARTIHHAGSDLLNLINDILDLTKVEAGKMDVIAGEVRLTDVCSTVDAGFRPLAEQKGLELEVVLDDGAPESIVTDQQRLQQVLKNLVSNAVKFTEAGSVSLHIGAAPKDMRFASSTLARSARVVSFTVSDTGIGIGEDQLRIVFEAFQQADGTISRRYGGTGLGLSISREITRLLGGEIRVSSTPGDGSVFTLFLPARFHDASPDGGQGRGSASGSAGASSGGAGSGRGSGALNALLGGANTGGARRTGAGSVSAAAAGALNDEVPPQSTPHGTGGSASAGPATGGTSAS